MGRCVWSGWLSAALATAMAPATLAISVAPASADGTKTVSYDGYHIRVPSEWPVYELSKDPTRCVRFDRHAVYLGSPGNQRDCPVRALGRSEALLIQPITERSRERVSASAVVVPQGRHTPRSLPEPVSHHIQVAVEEAGVLVSATYGDDRAAIERILGSASVSGAARPARVSAGQRRTPTGAELAQPVTTGASQWEGQGFDTCAAPSDSEMSAWLDSPYRAVGVYIGGIMRACAQPNLTREWVRSRHEKGWRLLPLYVGRQAPCTDFGARIDPSKAAEQGRAAADDAIAQLAELGLGEGSPVYFDMEFYDSSNDACRQVVLEFLDAWTRRLHGRGYVSGVYGSAAAVARDLGRADGIAKPDTIWFANWDGRATVEGDPYLSDTWWDDHQRIKQYRGGHTETHGGVSINIDSDVVDGHVAY